MATLLVTMMVMVLIHSSYTESCGDPVDVKAALVNNGRSIEFTWRPPYTGSVEHYSIAIGQQSNTRTDTKYLIQNPEKRLYTFSVTSYCGRSGGLSPNWVRTTIGFVGLAVYATIGQPSVSIRWTTKATLNNFVDVKNKDINTNIFFLPKSNVPILYQNQYEGRITYTGDLANNLISFTLSNVTSRDAGYYMSLVGTTDMDGQVLVVLDKPRKPTINNIFSYVGNHLELSCNSLKTSKPDYYTPELNYTWLIDGSVHVYNTRHQGRYRQNQDRLVIDNVTKEDKGRTFSCEASDRGQQSEQSNTITLDPRYGPRVITVTPKNTNNVVKIGNQFGPINCSAECNPSCTFTWKFMKTGGDEERREITRSNILTILQVTRQHDGQYRCVAKSTDLHVLTSTGTKTINLNVQFPPEIRNITRSVIGGPLRIISTRTPVVVSENDDVNLQCNIEANPKAMISWDRAGKPLSNITLGESLVYNLGTSISCETSGIYSCVADNGIAPAANRTIKLLVQCKPKLNRSVPVHNRYGSRLNSTVNISLSVIGYPRPIYRWETNTTALVNDRPISAINSYSFKYEGSVTIRRTSDFGTYCLQLTNSKGSSKLCLEIQEIQAEDVPMAPSNFGVENVSPEMITLTWISEFNGGIQQTFYLEYKELENDAGFTKINVSDSGETIRVTVKELKAGVYYTFKLYSRNALGDSQAQVIQVRTEDHPVKEPETSSSTGVYVGVAWVVFVVILVIVGIVVFVVLRRRKGSVENPASGVNTDGENAKTQSKAKKSPGRVNTGLVSRERAVPPNILNLDTTQNPDDMYSEIADASMSENVKTSDRQTSGTEHDNRMDADGYLSPTDIEHLGQLDESRKPYEKLLQEDPLQDNHGYMMVKYPGKGLVDSTNV